MTKTFTMKVTVASPWSAEQLATKIEQWITQFPAIQATHVKVDALEEVSVHRSADTGEFVTKDEAEANPKTTYKDRIRK